MPVLELFERVVFLAPSAARLRELGPQAQLVLDSSRSVDRLRVPVQKSPQNSGEQHYPSGDLGMATWRWALEKADLLRRSSSSGAATANKLMPVRHVRCSWSLWKNRQEGLDKDPTTDLEATLRPPFTLLA